MNRFLKKFTWTPELAEVLEECKGVSVPLSKQELYETVFGTGHLGKFDVVYDVPDRGLVCEATVVRAKNGIVVNYPEDYMRRRDPDSMRIGDDKPTDKPRFKDVYGYDFDQCKKETYEWLKTQELIVMPFNAGGNTYGYGSILICPRNAAFFAYSMALLQGFVSAEESEGFKPRAIVYVAPPFRHTHFGGKQVVVHNRLDDCHEVFSYNLYPGPSAKKGVYSVLLDIGEQEGWVTAHASCGRMVTQYDNELVIMHEGASGGGKSEMLQDIARAEDGRVVLSTNTITGESTYLHMGRTSHIEPVCDDMATCYPKLQNDSGKLVLVDGEDGWFLRMDGVTHMMRELEDICAAVEVSEILLTVDSMMGQVAVNVAKTFNERLEITGVILTKLDGDTRGGACLSIKAVTGKPIKFIGTGEKLGDLEPFYPDRMASRILGMGDVLTLIEKAQQAVTEEDAKKMQQKLRENSFTLEDYLEQFESMKKMGGLRSVMSMLPGVSGKIKEGDLDEAKMERTKAIILSMTKKEREDPVIINASRKRRIAAGSGTSVQEINQLLKQFDQVKTLMKQLKSGKRRLPF